MAGLESLNLIPDQSQYHQRHSNCWNHQARDMRAMPGLLGIIWSFLQGMVSSGRNETGEPVVRHCEMLNEAAMRYKTVALSS